MTGSILGSYILSTLIIPAGQFTNTDWAAKTHSIVIPTTVEADLRIKLVSNSPSYAASILPHRNTYSERQSSHVHRQKCILRILASRIALAEGSIRSD